jgi:hypothetical protein
VVSGRAMALEEKYGGVLGWIQVCQCQCTGAALLACCWSRYGLQDWPMQTVAAAKAFALTAGYPRVCWGCAAG